jgi:hypothetical protein
MEPNIREMLEGLLYNNCPYDHQKKEWIEQYAPCDDDGCCFYCGALRTHSKNEFHQEHTDTCAWDVAHKYLQAQETKP